MVALSLILLAADIAIIATLFNIISMLDDHIGNIRTRAGGIAPRSSGRVFCDECNGRRSWMLNQYSR